MCPRITAVCFIAACSLTAVPANSAEGEGPSTVSAQSADAATTAAQPAEVAAAPDPAKFRRLAFGRWKLDQTPCTTGVTVSFAGRAKLTQVAVDALAKRGCTAAAIDQGAPTLKIEGTYSDTNRGKTQEVALQDMVTEEPANPVVADSGGANPALGTPAEGQGATHVEQRGAVAHAIDAEVANAATNAHLISRPTGVASIATSGLQAIGLTGWINKKLFGDERGIVFCGSGCKVHTQAIKLVLTQASPSQTMTVNVSYSSESQIPPDDLLQEAVTVMVGRMYGEKYQ